MSAENITECKAFSDEEIMQLLAQSITASGKGTRPDKRHASKMLQYLRVLIDHSVDEELKRRR